MRYVTCCIVLAMMCSVSVASTSVSLVESPSVEPSPLWVGEKLTFNISWKQIPAFAERTDWIVRQQPVDGKMAYYIRSAMKTRGLLSLYHFRREEATYFGSSSLSPLRFENRLEDRKYRATVGIDFGAGEASYTKVSRAKPDAPERIENKVLEVPPGTQDELSTLYFLRSKALAVGDSYFFPIVTKGRVEKVTLRVARREVIKSKTVVGGTPLGDVETIVLETSRGNLFWLTDDARRLPVKAETKIGSRTVRATLVKVEFVN